MPRHELFDERGVPRLGLNDVCERTDITVLADYRVVERLSEAFILKRFPERIRLARTDRGGLPGGQGARIAACFAGHACRCVCAASADTHDGGCHQHRCIESQSHDGLLCCDDANPDSNLYAAIPRRGPEVIS